MIKFSLHKLKNGTTVLLAPMKDTQAVTLMVQIGVGSRYENPDNAGISHFLEHLFFKGTKKRPSTLKIGKELDRLGALYNAMTSEETTGFFIQSAGADFPKITEILADMIQNPLLDTKEVERERSVILEERNMYFDTPIMYVQELAKLAAFGDIPLGQDIIGTRKSISGIRGDQIAAYRSTHYRGENMIIAVAGKPGKKDWLKLIEKYFGAAQRALPGGRPIPAAEPYRFVPHSRIATQPKQTDQTHLVVSTLIPQKLFANLQTRAALGTAATILGGGMSSRLWLKIRERRGLAYYVKTDADLLKDIGFLTISTGLKNDKVKTALNVIRREFAAISRRVGKEELERAKQNIRGKLALSLEDSMSIAGFLLSQLHLYGKIHQPEEIIEATMEVSDKMVMKIAGEIFQPENLSLAAIGPEQSLKRLQIRK